MSIWASAHCLFIISLLFFSNQLAAIDGEAPVLIANEGFAVVRETGEPVTTCARKLDSADQTIINVASSTSFCTDPVGYMCGGARAQADKLTRFRQDNGFRSGAINQLAVSNDGLMSTGSIDSSKGGGSLFAAFTFAKNAIVKKLQGCIPCGSAKTRMIDKVNGVTLRVIANHQPTEDHRRKCGYNLMENVAEYVRDGNYVFVCLGKIVGSTPSATNLGDVNVGDYMMGTFGHEIGHSIDGILRQEGDPPYAVLAEDSTVRASYDSLYNCAGSSSTSGYSFGGNEALYKTYEAEINADYWSNVVLSKEFRPNNKEQLMKGRSTLCLSTGGAGTHPSTRDRIKMIRDNPTISAQMGCGAPAANACMAQGPVILP